MFVSVCVNEVRVKVESVKLCKVLSVNLSKV